MSLLQMPPKREIHTGILFKLAFSVPFGVLFGGTLGGAKMQLNRHPGHPTQATPSGSSTGQQVAPSRDGADSQFVRNRIVKEVW